MIVAKTELSEALKYKLERELKCNYYLRLIEGSYDPFGSPQFDHPQASWLRNLSTPVKTYWIVCKLLQADRLDVNGNSSNDFVVRPTKVRHLLTATEEGSLKSRKCRLLANSTHANSIHTPFSYQHIPPTHVVWSSATLRPSRGPWAAMLLQSSLHKFSPPSAHQST
ncbi:unnamed protein product, partial [Protopolystoma xenopodis]